MLAVISDIHGNLAALETVLKDINQQDISEIICLGDVANFGPQPIECIEQIAEVGCPIIFGNTDERLINPRTLEEDYRSEESHLIIDIENWCSRQLSQKHLDYLESYLPKLESEYKGISCVFYHGSPKKFTDLIVATTPYDVIEDYFSEYETRPTLCIGGHTHAQLLRRHKQSFIINPGCVGIPYEEPSKEQSINPSWAEYAIVDVIHSQPTVSFRRIPYDITPTLEAAKAMPHFDFWSRNWQQV